MLDRRELLSSAVVVGATSVVGAQTSSDTAQHKTPTIDTNATLFHWPFRRLPLDETAPLVKRMRLLSIGQAWVGSFEGLLHRDVSSVNRRLVTACAPHPELQPIGMLNVNLPGWERDLRECIDEHKMHGVRLFPNYHDYKLDDVRLQRLLREAAAAGLLVQIAVALEDARTQHPLVRVSDVDLQPLPDVVAKSRATVQLLNHRLRGAQIDRLQQQPAILFDTARVDATDGITNLVEQVGKARVLFGSHAPFLIPEAALIRVHESVMSETDRQAVLSGAAIHWTQERDR